MADYDDVAEWYDEWVRGEPGAIFGYAAELVPEPLVGQRVLDAACGQGRISEQLAQRGADVQGVDLSAKLIEMARRAEAETSHGVRYHVADLADADTWWDGQPFDGAICELALMDIEHFDTALAAIARTLKPGGWFIASIVHPCFPGNGTGLSSWPPDRGYTAEGWWTSPDHNPAGVRVRLGAHHRTLATYLNTLTDLGLILERVVEPPAEVPTLMVIRCRNAGSR